MSRERMFSVKEKSKSEISKLEVKKKTFDGGLIHKIAE